MRAEGSDQYLNPPTGVANKSACRWRDMGGRGGGGGRCVCLIEQYEQRCDILRARRGRSEDADLTEQVIVRLRDISQMCPQHQTSGLQGCVCVCGGEPICSPGNVPSSLKGGLLTGIPFLRSLLPNLAAAKYYTVDLLKSFLTFWTSVFKREFKS